MAIQFRVLGSLEAMADGAVAELGPPKQRALLASLLLHAGELLSVDRLIELLWGADAPRTAPHSIQIYVSDLRRALEPLGAADLLVTRPPGYVLEAERDSIDAWQFERLVRDGVRMLDEGDAEAGRAALRQALALWRGPVLSDFAYEEFAQPYIHRLNESHLDAIEALAASELDGGRTSEVAGLLQAAVREDPLRERSRELLMLALYRTGRHADALRIYDALRTQLADELGVDPSPPIRALYDRILFHDPALLPEREAAAAAEARNPYKGLRPFTEEDAPDFFGRDELVAQLLDALGGGARLVALVGPSGSGKSSVVAAGLVPRLRSGALPGSERWRIARMVPGANPLREAESAVARARAAGGGGNGGSRDLRAGDGEDRTLLVVDQFEHTFSAEEGSRDRFLDALAGAVTAPDARLHVVLTLRADFYDRPLLHPAFAAAFIPGVVHVVPMTPRELEAAIVEPARRVGVEIEPALLAELVADTADRPGSLPLLQYALTDLFEQRSGPVLTQAGYGALGGLRGLLSRRAESLYLAMGAEAQAAAMQVFLRLVRSGAGAPESQRRLALAELTDLGIDPVVLSEVLTTFGRHRLLTFDRDPATGRATVEVAHEALLVEWERLAGWIERHLAILRRHGALATAAEEWELSRRHPDYLLAGSRLEEFEPWLAGGVLQLSGRERAFLQEAVERRRTAGAAEAARAEARRQAERRSRWRFGALAATVFLLAAALTYALITGSGTGTSRVVLVASGGSVVKSVVEMEFDTVVGERGLAGTKLDTLALVEAEDDWAREVRKLTERRPALVVVWDPTHGWEALNALATERRDVRFLVLDIPLPPVLEPNVAYVQFRDWEGAFLAGVAAARTTRTGRIGFIGGADLPPIWAFQAGYEHG